MTDFFQQVTLKYPCKHILYALKTSYFYIVLHIIAIGEESMHCVPVCNPFFYFSFLFYFFFFYNGIVDKLAMEFFIG